MPLLSILRRNLLEKIALSSILPLLSLLTACGYHTDQGERTVSIPYFKGDTDGALTDLVIKALATSGDFHYTDRSGDLLLEGTIISDTNENIGYRFDRDSISNQMVRRLVPNEGRRKVVVEILLTDMRTQKVVYGPAEIAASGDYDFVDSDSLRDTSFIDATGAREPSLFFSMGQLDSIDGAQKAALDPIHHRLSLKIVEGISNLPYNAE